MVEEFSQAWQVGRGSEATYRSEDGSFTRRLADARSQDCSLAITMQVRYNASGSPDYLTMIIPLNAIDPNTVVVTTSAEKSPPFSSIKMKALSGSEEFVFDDAKQMASDPFEVAGNRTGSVTLNFPTVSDSDATRLKATLMELMSQCRGPS